MGHDNRSVLTSSTESTGSAETVPSEYLGTGTTEEFPFEETFHYAAVRAV